MIVHPDFLDHWKTKSLISLVGDDPAAPLMILRLWGYCQLQKKSVFETVPNLKSICRSNLPTETLLDHMISAGFLRRGDQNEIIVHDWEQCNRILRTSWENGKKGGNPSNFKPTGCPRDTHRLPAGSSVQKNRIEKVGCPRAGTKLSSDQPTGWLASPEEEEITAEQRAANHQKFAQLAGQISGSLKSGDPGSQVENL